MTSSCFVALLHCQCEYTLNTEILEHGLVCFFCLVLDKSWEMEQYMGLYACHAPHNFVFSAFSKQDEKSFD